MRSSIHLIQMLLATIVLLIAAIAFSDLPQPYPTWPTIWSVPVNPELIIPGLLGLVALLGAIRDGITVGSIVIGILGALTLWLAVTSLHTLYSPTGGGVFWGGFFTLISGTILAIAALFRGVVIQSAHRDLPHRIRDMFEG